MIKRTCDVHEEDQKLLEKYDEAVWMLTGMVEEAFVTNQTYLLSPVLRKAIRDKGREVDGMRVVLHNKLCVDNPGDPLVPYKTYE